MELAGRKREKGARSAISQLEYVLSAEGQVSLIKVMLNTM
jgi:hypothetical protein